VTRESPSDLRLLGPAVALWVACWGTPWLGPPAMAVLVAAAWCLGASIGRLAGRAGERRGAQRRRHRLWALSLAAGCALTGVVVCGLRLDALHSGPWDQWAATSSRISLSGTVVSDPSPSAGPAWPGAGPSATVTVRVTAAQDRLHRWVLRAPVLVFGQGEGWLDLRPGTPVSLDGAVRPAPAAAPLAAVVFARGAPRIDGAPAPWWRGAERLRTGLREAASGLPPDVAGLLPALVVGDTTAMPPDLADDLRAAGLAHLTAVSGANITIILVAVLLAARYAGVRGYALPVLGLVTVLAFVIVARPQPSVVRAVVMGGLAVMGVLLAGRRVGVQSLLAAVVGLLLIDPWLARSWGFALSVAATGGLLVLAPAWRDTWSARLPRPVAESLAIAVAAQAATLPLQLALAGTVGWAAVPANLAAEMAVAPATVLGAMAGVVSLVSVPVASLIAWVAGWPLAWIAGVARWGAATPLPDVHTPGGVVGLVVGLVLVAVVVAVLRRAGAVSHSSTLGQRVTAAVLVVVLLVAWWGTRARWPPPGWVMVACDVGQGDALVLAAGRGTAMVVDAGPDVGAVDRCLRRLGVTRVPVVVLTHDHADHVDGLPGVLRGRDVGQVLVSPLDDPLAQASAVRREAASAGLPVSPLVAGQRGVLGSLAWQVLWPARIIRGEGSDPNNASVVLLVEVNGVRLLLTGDVEPPAQGAMMTWAAQHGVDLHADVLKVPHHGSANQDPALWDAVDPRTAVISVGADNTYGHPDPQLVATLQARGIPVERTDLDGDIAVVLFDDDDTLRVVTR